MRKGKVRGVVDPAPAPGENPTRAMPVRRTPFRLAVLPLLLAGCTFVKAAWNNAPTLESPGDFDCRVVQAAPGAAPLPAAPVEVAPILPPALAASYASFDDLLLRSDTRAFLVLRDDHIVYERYFGHFARDSLFPSFSLSKSFAALLVGCALEDGLIPSLQARLTDFVPELAKRPGYAEVQLDHLLRMVSGIEFEEESYDSATLYYCADLHGPTLSFPVTAAPGTVYRYGSINVQLLWEVLHRQLAPRTVAAYFEQRIWRPLGAEHAAAWSIDSEANGVEKLFTGLGATARDFARLGLLFLHEGRWNGARIVSPDWVHASLSPDPVAGLVKTTDGTVVRGRYQWFLTADRQCWFAKGYRGQYVWVDPAARAVVVRFGDGYGDLDWPALLRSVSRG